MTEISVIIPTYGEPRFLDRTIQSVLNQTFQDFELIVVDDNNPETEARNNTEKLIDSIHDQRIQYIKHSRNLNGAAARNTGISHATGKYIAFLDSDDEYKSERLEKCFCTMERADTSVAGVYTGCEFRKSGKVYHTYSQVKDGNYLVETLACTFMFCTGSNLFVRKSIVDELNGFDESFLRHQDYEFLVRLFKKYSLKAISDILVIKNNENINLPNAEIMIDIKKHYLEKYKSLIRSRAECEKMLIYHSQYMQIAEAAQRTKKYKLARIYYDKAKEQGGLSVKERFRRVAFIGINLLK